MINILPCVQEFYILQSLDAEKITEQFKKSHEKWEDDLLKYKEIFTVKFAQVMHDYLFLIAGGEARHAIDKASHYILNLTYLGDRSKCYDFLKAFNPELSVDRLIEVYKKPWRASGYGGEKWAQIAQTIKMFYTNKKSPNYLNVIIDHCVDLSHNGGVCFTKTEADLLSVTDPSIYISFLDHKKQANHIKNLMEDWAYCYKDTDNNEYGEVSECEGDYVGMSRQLFISLKLISLIDRGIELGIIPKMKYSVEHPYDFSKLLHYTPIEWGDKEMSNLGRGMYYQRHGTWKGLNRPIDLPAAEVLQNTEWNLYSIPEPMKDETCTLHCSSCSEITCSFNQNHSKQNSSSSCPGGDCNDCDKSFCTCHPAKNNAMKEDFNKEEVFCYGQETSNYESENIYRYDTLVKENAA